MQGWKHPDHKDPRGLALIFRDGAVAGRVGMHIDHCGYPPGSDAWKAFQAGMLVGRAAA